MIHSFIKRIAVFTLIAFFFTVCNIDYSLASEYKDGYLKSAKKYYDEGDQGSALAAIYTFFSTTSLKVDLKVDYCLAYFLQAKIYFESGYFDKMKTSLYNLYGIDPNFTIPPGEYTEFKEEAQKIQDEVLNRLVENKSEPSGVILVKGVQKAKKKKFPILAVLIGVAVVVTMIILVLKKSKKYTLTTIIGEGVEGTPAAGTATYKNGSTINYSYLLKSGYSMLVVKIDGNGVDASGTIKMDQNHTLTASAAKTYVLTVVKGVGVEGTPGSGTFPYNAGDTVNYSYTLQNGYTDLVVKIDGLDASASGTITMNGDHTFSVSAGKIFKLTVTKGTGVDGQPNSGTYDYKQGDITNYSYSFQPGYTDLLVTVDGNMVADSGDITMDRDHTLVASTKKTYTLTVTRGTGVEGTPLTGIYTYKEGDTVVYNYNLMANFKNLVVTIDGKSTPAPSGQSNGVIMMNKDHTLSATAAPL